MEDTLPNPMRVFLKKLRLVSSIYASARKVKDSASTTDATPEGFARSMMWWARRSTRRRNEIVCTIRLLSVLLVLKAVQQMSTSKIMSHDVILTTS
jgi:hypothetical protein